jgi:predicted glycosyltransferase
VATTSIVLICDVYFGIGHLSRIFTLSSALTSRFRVIVITVGGDLQLIEPPAGVELHCFPRPGETDLGGFRSLTSRMLAVVTAARPGAVLIEYFPFGRHFAAIYLLPLMKAVRAMHDGRPAIICTLRDIQQRTRPGQDRFDLTAVRMANEYFDLILVHSDPRVTRLDDTFARVSSLRVPIEYTRYVSRHSRITDTATARSSVIVVSVGGGRGGETLLRMAVAAARTGLLKGYRIRILAGAFLLEQDWEELSASCSEAPDGLELLRWAPDLFNELRSAAVSVSRCGYNTAQDLLASRVPALVVPYSTPHDDEQTERATILARMGLARMIPEDGLTGEALAAEILATVPFQPRSIKIGLDGAERTCDILSEMLTAKAGVTHPVS